MKEECGLRQSDNACGIVATDSMKFFARNIGQVRAAVCMKCGEVSVYVDMKDIEKYQKKE